MELINKDDLLANLRRFAPEKYDALVNMLIMKQPEVEAIPIDWIVERIDMLNEYISNSGDIHDIDTIVNAKLHAVAELVRLIADWRKENGQTD